MKLEAVAETEPKAVAAEDKSVLYLFLKAASIGESSSRYAGGGKWFDFYGLIHGKS